VSRAWLLMLWPVQAVQVRISAVRALRLNYTWRGVFVWLKGRKRSTGQRGFVVVLRDPARVVIEQHAVAEGVFS
jgi:hypothetical protein